MEMKVPTNLVPSSADMIVFKQVGQLVGIYEKIILIIRQYEYGNNIYK